MRLPCTLLLALVVAAPAGAAPGTISLERGGSGTWYQYVPRAARGGPVLVVVHGSIPEGGTAEAEAREYILRWTSAAETHGTVLVAPAFDRKDYQAHGGYRGLFGRTVGADRFVLDILEGLRPIAPAGVDRFMLYGHSAGGQFAVRFAVTHPKRVRRVVASAPGRYAFPDAGVAWPYGMGRFQRSITWKDPKLVRDFDFVPDPEGWVRAAAVDIHVVVGARDVEPQPRRPGHRGTTRVDHARQWVGDMNDHARRHGARGRVQLDLVPGVGHSSRQLTPRCRALLFPAK